MVKGEQGDVVVLGAFAHVAMHGVQEMGDQLLGLPRKLG